MGNWLKMVHSSPKETFRFWFLIEHGLIRELIAYRSSLLKSHNKVMRHSKLWIEKKCQNIPQRTRFTIHWGMCFLRMFYELVSFLIHRVFVSCIFFIITLHTDRGDYWWGWLPLMKNASSAIQHGKFHDFPAAYIIKGHSLTKSWEGGPILRWFFFLSWGD